MSEPSKFGSRNETSRRSVIKGAAALAGVSAAPLSDAWSASTLPAPASSGIDHIVVLMMENRSFDHILGWLPGANGVQAGRGFVDTAGNTVASHPLTLFQNCSSSDPDHSWQGGRTQLAGGAMNGFLLTQPVGDSFPVGYYGASQVPFFAMAARYWTICDSYHCSILGPTWPNRFYMHSGQTDRLTTGGPTPDTNSLLSILPTIWDAAAAAGVSARYYYGDEAFTALWGAKYAGISFLFSQFLTDAAAGNLPSISYVDPRFVGEAQGTSNDDHPLADIRNGQVLMNTVYQALTSSPNWAKTLLIINYDEWGGFADHVVPEMAPVSAHEANTVGNLDATVDGTPMAYLGFRVPCVLIGPRARRGSIAGGQYDANAILNFICWRFGLPGIGVRSATSGNIATALNFSGAPDTAIPPQANLVNQVYGQACSLNPEARLDDIERNFGEHFAQLAMLRKLMDEHGFPRA